MPIFDAVNHSIAALSTGGFSTKTDSIGAYGSLTIEFITIILMILGTVNFAVHYMVIRGRVRSAFRVGEIKTMFVLMAVGIPVTAIFSLYKLYGSLGKSFRIATFELVSALSTTGFSTVTYTKWSGAAVFFMIAFMITGCGTRPNFWVRLGQRVS